MSWEDQGRQEHGWFGNGTAPPKDDAGTGRSDVEQRQFGATGSAEVAGARAYAWAKAYGPALFGLPRTGAALDRFADEVGRREQARPSSAARALDRWAAQGKFGEQAKAVRYGLLVLVQERRGGGDPTRMPGGGFGDVTPSEELRQAEFDSLQERLRQADPQNPNLQFLRAPDSVPSEEEIVRLRAAVAAAEERARLRQPPERLGVPSPERGGAAEPETATPSREPLHFHDWDQEASTPSGRDAPGVATNSAPLPPVTGPWLRGSEGNVGLVPGQVADKLRGQHFDSFDKFRSAFWKAVADTPELATQFSQQNLGRMRQGLAPIAPENQHRGEQRSYVLHHRTPVSRGGRVYDMSNIVIATPSAHQSILDPKFHFRGNSP